MLKSANLLHKCGLGDSDMSSTVSWFKGTLLKVNLIVQKNLMGPSKWGTEWIVSSINIQSIK